MKDPDFLKAIRENNTSGSGDLLEQMMAGFESMFNEHTAISGDEITKALNRYLKEGCEFALLFHFINAFCLFAEKAGPQISGQEGLEFLMSYKDKWKNANSRIYRNLRPVLPEGPFTALLHSQSATILGLFSHLKQQGIMPRIYQTVSRPAKEGILAAEKLAKQGFQVNLIEDASVARYVEDIDVAWLGADVITPGYFINKTGSASIAMHLQYSGKPVYVLSDSRKIISADQLPASIVESMTGEKSRPSSEIYEGRERNIRVLNFYFEKTDNNRITEFITEKKRIAPGDLPEYCIDQPVSGLIDT